MSNVEVTMINGEGCFFGVVVNKGRNCHDDSKTVTVTRQTHNFYSKCFLLMLRYKELLSKKQYLS